VALAKIQNEPTPQTPEQQEAFFQECVAEGEKLATMGMSHFTSRVPTTIALLRHTFASNISLTHRPRETGRIGHALFPSTPSLPQPR
jgi:hypothetical protein